MFYMSIKGVYVIEVLFVYCSSDGSRASRSGGNLNLELVLFSSLADINKPSYFVTSVRYIGYISL